MKLLYISHGENETGGYRYEGLLSSSLGEVTGIRYRRNFVGFTGWLLLFWKAFWQAKSEVIVTVVRLAWPVYLRNIFNKTKIILVVHNYDRRDGKPRLYYWLLDKFLKVARKRTNKICVVVVADYWKQYFEKNFGMDAGIFIFPNLFEYEYYAKIAVRSDQKAKKIHLGQMSDKIDENAYYGLIPLLRTMGYECYFSTNIKGYDGDFPVVYFDIFDAYLQAMASAEATVILNKIDEGWNRVAHESVLVGTPVIGNGGGGFGELLKKFNGHLIKDFHEIPDLLKAGLQLPDDLHDKDFDLLRAEFYAEPIKVWMNR